MKPVFYQIDDVVEVSHDPDIKAIHARWLNLGPHEHLRPTIQAELDYVTNNTTTVIIVDLSTAIGILKRADQDWFRKEMFQKFEDTGVKAMITILSKTNLPQIAAEQWTKTGSAFDMDFINADSLETARALAQKYQ